MRVAAVSGPDAGHLLPVVALALELRRRGHDVTVLTGPDWRADVEAEGIGFRELPALAPTDRDDDIGWRMWGRGAQMAPALADLLAPDRPEVVVADTLAVGGRFAAELLRAPWVEVVPHWLWEPSAALPPIGLGMPPGGTALQRLHAWHLRRMQARSFEEGAAQRAEARASLGLDREDGRLATLLATLPALELPRPDWPSRTWITGALTWEPSSWPTLEPPPGDAPVVLVSDSTVSNVGTSLGPVAIDALRRDRVRTVITTGRPLEAPPDVVVGRGRHAPLLDAAAAVVSFGGHGLVSKALAAGVPVIVVPLQGDQRETAMRVEHAGAGLAIDPHELDAPRLRDAVHRVLHDPPLRTAAGRVAAGTRGLGPGRAAWLIERRLGRGLGQVSRRFSPTS